MESVCNEVRRGEIYYAKLNPVRGSEQGKTRPVLILQNDVGNHYSSTTIVAAITGRRKRHCFPTHVPIKINGLKPSSVIMLEGDFGELGILIGGFCNGKIGLH